MTPTPEYLKEIAEVENPYSALMKAYYPKTPPFWDETAVAIMVHPEIVTGEIECMLAPGC